jgi:hypothetical protein
MTQLIWDTIGDRVYETGVDHGVLYLPDSQGNYDNGVAWSGLTNVTESPSGAEATPQYADNIKYLNLYSAEDFSATVEAFTWPDEFNRFDGSAQPTPGVMIGQQNRPSFGLSYRTLKGNDLEGNDYGYKLHLIYGCKASPSEKAYGTVNDSPEAITFSWSLSTTPVAVPGHKPSATIIIDSTLVNPARLAQLEQQLYGAPGVDPILPTPAVVLALMSDDADVVTPTVPTYNSSTDVLTIPAVTGVAYFIGGIEVPAGTITLTEDTIVEARPKEGYVFAAGVDDDWAYEYTP